ncbi:MAG: S8 family serine peptidase [Candidatus Coatesbacteria bacterium]|nr:S8 family serine peptidase [Candidatus Coatesbacteria bacterium]
MRKLTVTLLLILAVGALALAPEAKLTEFLQGYLATTPEGELLPCYITLNTQLDRATAAQLSYGRSKEEARVAVVDWLKATAAAEQAGLLDYLQASRATGEVGDYQPFWLSNFVFAELSEAAIMEIAERPEVVRITRGSDGEGLWIGLGFPSEETAEPVTMYENGREIAWGVTQVNADDVWALGYTGDGVSVVVGDTGQRYTHHDLYSHYDASISYDYSDDDSDPYFHSGESHGTHCAGSVGSDGTAGTQAGVAPDYTYGAHRLYMMMTYTGELSVWNSWQGAVNWGVDVVSNSLGWTDYGNPDRPTWRTNAQNAIAAGVTLVIAAGNEGPGAQTLRCPGDVPEVITVGATNSSDVIASFSSRGPSTEYGDTVIKPDVSAPGVGIKSCYTSSDTAYDDGWNGTSMATPHVAGAVALLLEADPTLTPAQLKLILEDTAIDLGDPGKDNAYGSGRIDALAAVQSLGPIPAGLSLISLEITNDDNGDGKIDPGESIELEVTVENTGDIAAENAAGTLFTTDGNITISDDTADFGTISGGSDATDTVTFEVDNSVTPPDSFEFTLTLEADNVSAVDHEFDLFVPTDEIDDDVEGGEGYWTHSGDQDSWHISDQEAYSPTHSWKCGDTGSGDYSPNMNASLYSPPVWFTAADSTLVFQTLYKLQYSADYGYVEINDGNGWTELTSYNGLQNDFAQESIDLASYAETTVQLRFRMQTNGSGNLEGWYIDDIQLPEQSSAAPWVAIETINGEDGLLLTWNADGAFSSFNVYRETDGGARIKLNERALDGGASGAWLDTPASGTYLYYVEGIDSSGEAFTYGPVEVEIVEPTLALTLSDPYPNPAVGQVSFDLTTAEREQVSLVVYDLSGRRVATVHDGELSAGRHTLTWSAETAAGVYIARLETAGQVLTRRVVIDR